MTSNKGKNPSKVGRLKGSTKTITEIFEENLDCWPTRVLKRSLEELQPEEGAEVYLSLNEGDYDLTEQCLAIEKKFRPIVTLRTRALKTELTRWRIGGGSFFRVIGNASSEEKAIKLCIQYLIIWTRQLFPFNFTFLSMPFFLATLFFWQFSQEFTVTETGAGIYPGVYLALFITGILFVLLGTWTIFEGIYRKVFQGIKNWKTIPDSMIGFVVPGLLFWTTTLEYAIIRWTGGTTFPTIIPISGWVSLLLGVIILIIGIDFFLRGEKSFVERFSHPQDYAPLFLFLERDQENEWQIEGAQFDFFHYKTVFVPKEQLVFDKDIPSEERTHAKFIIDRSWHAFREYIKPNIVLRLFSHWLVVLIGLVAFTLYVLVIWINWTAPWLLYLNNLLGGADQPWVFTISNVLAPLALVAIVWAYLRTREYELPIWEELAKKEGDELLRYHQLTYDRLRILWNLRDKEATGESFTSFWTKETWIEGCKSRLVARVKLQYPFDRYKDWQTLRDTQEELLSIVSLQTKERELEKLQEEIEAAKLQLIKQRAITQKQIAFWRKR